MRRLKDVTHVGRFFDPASPSNRFALLAPIGAGLILFGLDSTDLPGAVAGALATFAAWAIARELDPDHARSATLAAGLTPVATIVVGTPAPGALFVTMLTLRIVVRTTGLPPKTTDLAALTIGAIAVAGTPWGWAAGILLAFGMVRDAALAGHPPPNAGLWGVPLAIGVTARVGLAEGLGVWDAPGIASAMVLVVGLLASVVVTRPGPLLSLTDWTQTPLEPQRLREAAVFGMSTAALAFVAGGESGVVAFAPLLLAYVAVAGTRLLDR